MIESLAKQGAAQQKEVLEFEKTYKIRIKGEDDAEDDAQPSKGATQQGVLVSNDVVN